MNSLKIETLKEKLGTLERSAAWLKRSYNQCVEIGIKTSYTQEEFDHFENLTSRYARTTDMFVNQVLRCLDMIESVDSGTVIDIMNRAEKRGIVESADTLHELKDLRNEITHEYQIEKVESFYNSVLHATPVLFKFMENLHEYCRKYLS
jgi:uncharacterized protein YutE (UPF0331/DUF86 family)